MEHDPVGGAQTPVIALVGCGIFAERYYLPALARYPAVLARTILVDVNPARLEALAGQYAIRQVATDYRAALAGTDGVIVATPHDLHYPVALAALDAGAHVLCEKPLAGTLAQARALVVRAEEQGVTISANYTQRLFPSSRKIKALLDERALGRLLSIEYCWGAPFTWPTVSGFYLNATESRAGVLLDRGAHAIDLICWWLGGTPSLIAARHDSFGGPEAVAEVCFECVGCTASVTLSWINNLPNRYVIRAEGGTIVNGIDDWWCVPVRDPHGKLHTHYLPGDERDYCDFGRQIVDNFLAVIQGAARPLIPAGSVLDAVALIEECYRRGTRFAMPWYDNLERFHA